MNYTITLSDGVTTFDVYDHEVDGGSILSTPRAIQSINVGLQTFKLLDDLTYRFTPGFQFNIVGSGGANGTYTVAPAGSTYATPYTSIPVVEVIPSAGLPLGNITYTIPSSTTLVLPGRGTVNYGQNVLTNLVHLLETFASITSPSTPIKGQLWFDTSANLLKAYDGTSFISNLTTNQTITLTNDVTGSGTSSIVVTLAASGVVAGTYTKLTVDTKGRVTVGASLSSGDVTTALGFTPVNKAGDTMTGFLTLNADPTTNLQAATKQYVDTVVGSVTTYQEFTAGATQTVFNTTISTASNTSGGTGHLQVFVNGVYQLEGATKAYMVTGANQITFNAAVPASADVVLYSF